MNATLLLNGNRAISRDEIDTFFKEAMAIVNNTPLHHLHYHSDEPMPLTAANLMTLKDSPNPPPIETFTEADLNAYGKMRWRRVQHLSNEFWHRWRRDVLSEMISRAKWTKDRVNLSVNDVVTVKAKNLPWNDWKIGVVADVIISDDGVVRACKVRTATGSYVRPVCELIPLISKSGAGVSRRVTYSSEK